jgi:type IV pilus assembly protein PilA
MNVTVRNQKGFSLVELMVVVAIIGILAAIAIPNFQRFAAKSKQAEAKANLAALYSAERSLQAEWQTFATGFNITGYRPTGWVRYEHGFAASFPAAMPPGYAGPPLPDPNFNSTAYCGLGAIGPNNCGVINAPVPPGAVAGTAMTANTFLAQARADISSGAVGIDLWTINQAKAIANTFSGLP